MPLVDSPLHSPTARPYSSYDARSGMLQGMVGTSFFTELHKRKVFQTAALYIAVAWGATEILVTVAERLFMPAWIPTLVVIAFVVGFPVAMFLAWTFDITPEGIRRTTIESRRGKASVVFAVVLLFAGSAGLFLLIEPALQSQQAGDKSVAAVPNSLAVLPFVNASQDPADAWLSEGLSDELRDHLGRVAGIRVAARSSSVAARAQDLDALAISERLRVTHLVEGSVLVYGQSEAAKQLAEALAQSGHGVHFVENETDFALEMGKGGYDVVIAAYSDHAVVESGHVSSYLVAVRCLAQGSYWI